MELGTIDYPYKELSYAFIEILNYHSHTDRNLTVNLMEGTTIIFGLRQGNIVNMTNVDIAPYSLTSSEPAKATILIKDEIEIVKRPGTLFNVMKTFEQRLDEQIFNNSGITEEEKLRIEFNDYNILVQRSNFMMQNMNVISERADILNDVTFLSYAYIQQKTITLKNMHFNVSGTLSMTYDPLNMNLINIDVDYYRSVGGFDQQMFCNYPEAEHNTTIFADNVHFYYGKDRALSHVKKQMLRNQQPGNFIVNNYISEVWVAPFEQYGLLVVYLNYE